jgi:hypothetical protein
MILSDFIENYTQKHLMCTEFLIISNSNKRDQLYMAFKPHLVVKPEQNIKFLFF